MTPEQEKALEDAVARELRRIVPEVTRAVTKQLVTILADKKITAREEQELFLRAAKSKGIVTSKR
jgi:hypothetical protein